MQSNSSFLLLHSGSVELEVANDADVAAADSPVDGAEGGWWGR